jgi:hypothetical protein
MHLLLLAVSIDLLLPWLSLLLLHQWIDARLSGWNRLARLYRAPDEPAGRRFERVTFCMNARCYRRIGTIAMGSEGLHMQLHPLFRFLHPPLLIPWRNLKTSPAGSIPDIQIAAGLSVHLRLDQPVHRELIRQLEFRAPPNWRPVPRRPAA